MAFEAAIRYVGVIGEAANHLPLAITRVHPEIPWPAIVEMRNIVVHEYFDVDTEIVTTVLDRDLAPLAAALREHRDAQRQGSRRPDPGDQRHKFETVPLAAIPLN